MCFSSSIRLPLASSHDGWVGGRDKNSERGREEEHKVLGVLGSTPHTVASGAFYVPKKIAKLATVKNRGLDSTS